MVIKRTSKTCAHTPARELTKLAGELQGAVDGLLASPLFVRSRRLGSLLSYLAQHSQQEGEGSPSEYDIGIAVFRRDPAVYCTGDDPVVRVQIGRLRRKLATYYATLGVHEALRLSVPPGGYRLCCVQQGRPLADGRPAVLYVRPFSCLTGLGGVFARGWVKSCATCCSMRLAEPLCMSACRVARRSRAAPWASPPTCWRAVSGPRQTGCGWRYGWWM